MIVSIYVRVSTGRQEKEETIESQIAALQELAKKEGHSVVKAYKDEGWSGSVLARPALDEMRDDATKKIWEAVLFYDRDRLARKLAYQELIIEELEEKGIKAIFHTEPLAEDAEGRVLQQIKGVFSEYERIKIAERMRRGKLFKARNGNVVTSCAPYGYTYIPKQGNVYGYYKINRQEAAVVKMIFGWVADEGLTMRKIVKRLKELKILPRRNKEGLWNTSTLTTLLRRKAYIGTTYYNRSYAVVPEKPLKNTKYKKVKKTSRRFRPKDEWIEIPVPPIIDEELFLKARRQLKKNYELCDRNRKNKYLLAGKIFCECGKRRAGEGPQKGKHLYYRCTDRVYSFPLKSKCGERGINARVADVLVWRGIRDFMSSPELVKQQVFKLLDEREEKNLEEQKSTDDLRSELDKIKNQEQRYIKAYGAEMITIEQLKEATKELKVKKSLLERQVAHVAAGTDLSPISMPKEEEIDTFCDFTQKFLKNLSFQARRRIVLEVVDKIVGTQLDLKVYGNLPVSAGYFATIKKGGIQDVKQFSFSRNCRPSKQRQVNSF